MEKELLNELHELNSTLASLKISSQNSSNVRVKEKSMPLSDYFESLAERVILRAELEENGCEILANLPLSSRLSPPKNRAFGMPENYFEENMNGLYARVLAEVNREDSEFNLAENALQLTVLSEKPSFYKRYTKVLAVKIGVGFAAAAMVAGVFFHFNNQAIDENISGETSNIFSEIAQSEAIAYTNEHAYEIDETQLTEHIGNLPFHAVLGVSHETVLDYLDETGGMIED